MLVRRLVDHAASDPDSKPFHRRLRFDWELALTADGAAPGGLQRLMETDAAGRSRGVEHLVPTTVRTVGVAPNLAADDVQYVLGWSDADTKPDRVARCHEAFVDLTLRWADSPEAQGDPVPQALARFYRDGHAEAMPRVAEAGAKQRVLITVKGEAAYRARSVQAFWSAEVASRKGSGGRRGLCLSCGVNGPLLDTLPGKVPAKLVPGASNDAALVSINERVFGYDLNDKLICSPLCVSCGEQLTAGLTRVLASRDTASYGGQDSRLAWWITKPVRRDPMRVMVEADPAQVRELLNDVRKGRPSNRTRRRDSEQKSDMTKFCALTVGGNVARVMVRDWLESPLEKIEDNAATWFEQAHVMVLHPDESEWHSLTRLVRVTGRWQRDRRQYVPIGAKGADRPDGVQRDLLIAAMRGTRLPHSLTIHLLNRVRTDGHLDTPRAALLRLALLRSPSTTEKPMPGLDETNTNSAYVAGRLFAALDAIQYDAFEGKVNATYSRRHFQGAVTNPRAALIAGRKLADAWLRKFRGTRVGTAVNHSRELDRLYGLLGPDSDVPYHATPEQQSLFLLGYHHQRAHRFETVRRRAEERDA
ncbi:type I-C CRISPR-associated protein Cas8c/Csd1 [Saccharothrix violaceirubra]|uniref:CRISPR-associated protein Csd1 n=1 Tax=Saccharothrix violaceirubra TaxID=413306 RepID=A0A7W7SYU4_9PSEU|nr:type I-C CRISPR-associated protein Cas8c/Csd1 [Saccharothrix violaceirubra]MBB4963478.1 CRISPR-associated protein Csd1 [Saccharothrix violaceirubra]